MLGAIPPLPQYFFMAWCLVKHRNYFTFTLETRWKGMNWMHVAQDRDH